MAVLTLLDTSEEVCIGNVRPLPLWNHGLNPKFVHVGYKKSLTCKCMSHNSVVVHCWYSSWSNKSGNDLIS